MLVLTVGSTGIPSCASMRVLVYICIFSLFVGTNIFGAQLPDLPKVPSLPFYADIIDEALSLDSSGKWAELSEYAKQNAVIATREERIDDAANWYYASILTGMFSREGRDAPAELKRALLENMPAFFDCYETAPKAPYTGVFSTLSQIYLNQPAQLKKYMRMGLALSLVYASVLPPSWPSYGVPDEPTQVSQPAEIFLYFTLNGPKMPFDFSKMTVGELVFVVGIAGPLTELEKLCRAGFEPSDIEKEAAKVKADPTRLRGGRFAKWDTDVAFTFENLLKNGGSDYERTYYAFRNANANGIPCVFFKAVQGGDSISWLSYMNGAKEWKNEVFKDPKLKGVYAKSDFPATWNPLTRFELSRIQGRANVEGDSYKSLILSRLGALMLEEGDNQVAFDLASKALKADKFNAGAYRNVIVSRARMGAESKELDGIFRQSYEVFADYPEQIAKMLMVYRENLLARRQVVQADALFNSQMKPLFRSNPSLATYLYSDVLESMLDNAPTPTRKYSVYSGIVRSASKAPAEAFKYIVVPTAKYFWNNDMKKEAFKVIKSAESMLRGAGFSAEKDELARLREQYEEMDRQDRQLEQSNKKNRR